MKYDITFNYVISGKFIPFVLKFSFFSENAYFIEKSIYSALRASLRSYDL